MFGYEELSIFDSVPANKLMISHLSKKYRSDYPCWRVKINDILDKKLPIWMEKVWILPWRWKRNIEIENQKKGFDDLLEIYQGWIICSNMWKKIEIGTRALRGAPADRVFSTDFDRFWERNLFLVYIIFGAAAFRGMGSKLANKRFYNNNYFD